MLKSIADDIEWHLADRGEQVQTMTEDFDARVLGSLHALDPFRELVNNFAVLLKLGPFRLFVGPHVDGFLRGVARCVAPGLLLGFRYVQASAFMFGLNSRFFLGLMEPPEDV